jgi:hypothetical protein
MSDTITTDTPIAGENMQPVTDTGTEPVKGEVKSEKEATTSSEKSSVEFKDGKTYVQGQRVYSRDETNRIAATAKNDAEAKILQDLDIDSFSKVKSVINQLRTDTTEGETLNVSALKDAVAKKEQTVEELRSELKQVRTDYALKEHVGNLKDHMPANWTPIQKDSVVKLMKVDNMLHLEGETFAIKNGDGYYTTDGETPDYSTAVKEVGKSLGLPFSKQGVTSFDVDKTVSKTEAVKPVNQERLKSHPAYRNAYVSLRSSIRGSRADITDATITKAMK